MRRRDVLIATGSIVSFPPLLSAQQVARVKRVGLLLSGDPGGAWQERALVFMRTLAQYGWRQGENVQIEQRWGGNDPRTMDAGTRELMLTEPDVVLVGPTNALKALQPLARGTPIVFVLVSDPLGQGIVDSLARPSGNLTGFTNLEFSMSGKWLDILKETSSTISHVGLMIHTSNASSAGWFRTFQEAGRKAGVTTVDLPVRDIQDVDRGIDQLGRASGGSALVVPGDSFMSSPSLRRHVVERTSSRRIPALSATHEFAADGGLIVYGIDDFEPFRLAAGYVDRILRGEKTSNLPVQQPTRFRFAINLKTAKALGLTVPLSLQVAADEVIE